MDPMTWRASGADLAEAARRRRYAPHPLSVMSKWLEVRVNSLFKNLQAQLNKCVSKTNGEAILALAQLSYASHLHKSSKKAKH